MGVCTRRPASRGGNWEQTQHTQCLRIHERGSGFGHNAVAPLDMATPIPIIVCASIRDLNPAYIWLGGGEVDLKIRLNVEEFIAATGAVVGDISEPDPSAV